MTRLYIILIVPIALVVALSVCCSRVRSTYSVLAKEDFGIGLHAFSSLDDVRALVGEQRVEKVERGNIVSMSLKYREGKFVDANQSEAADISALFTQGSLYFLMIQIIPGDSRPTGIRFLGIPLENLTERRLRNELPSIEFRKSYSTESERYFAGSASGEAGKEIRVGVEFKEDKLVYIIIYWDGPTKTNLRNQDNQ